MSDVSKSTMKRWRVQNPGLTDLVDRQSREIERLRKIEEAAKAVVDGPKFNLNQNSSPIMFAFAGRIDHLAAAVAASEEEG